MMLLVATLGQYQGTGRNHDRPEVLCHGRVQKLTRSPIIVAVTIGEWRRVVLTGCVRPQLALPQFFMDNQLIIRVCDDAKCHYSLVPKFRYGTMLRQVQVQSD